MFATSLIIYIELSKESTEKLLEWIRIQKGSWIWAQPKNSQLHFSTPVVTNPLPKREPENVKQSNRQQCNKIIIFLNLGIILIKNAKEPCGEIFKTRLKYIKESMNKC